MLENRSQYRRLLRAVFTLVLLIVYGLIFWVTWHKYYSPRMERMFWRKGHLLIVGLYLFAIYLVARIYNGWKTGYIRVFNIIFAQTVGAIITNIGAYVDDPHPGTGFHSVGMGLQQTVFNSISAP